MRYELNKYKRFVKIVLIVFCLSLILPMFVVLIFSKSDFGKKFENVKRFIVKENEINKNKVDFNKIKVYNSKLNTIQEIPLEDYIYGVVAAEMPVSFEIEALKAQAVAARTFAITKILTPCPQANGGDVCSTTHCQVYVDKNERIRLWENGKGQENWNKIVQAVSDTKDMVLSYYGELVMYPQFFSISSGKTENSEAVFSQSVPYLKSVDSPGEEIAPKFKSSKTVSYGEFVGIVNNAYYQANLNKANIKSQVKILGRNTGGTVSEVALGNVRIKGTDFRKLFSLNSANFNIQFNLKGVTINCIGYGHDVGLSQWGANVMAKNGNKFNEILTHYYTGVKIVYIEDVNTKGK
ncbi:stage II sporulation protein D [Clostridium polyendosporum]|uniref:Stage II sporulation protein D n=1 Tax=Clostridium polyendosporum TaxID=69208 RepID=A0A919VEY8_9CLOT|nr:stage II sporulation protein D [Clostridium polyendosporum]GIM29684.1 stage II sporulation protein D [Clostridium polyendosporum]